MNAYELADFLEKNMVASVAILGDVTATHIVSTLRQQADELIDAGGMISMLREKLAQQTKPLSDEEIKEIADSVCYLIDKDKKDRLKGSMYIEDFARAIEERHGIK